MPGKILSDQEMAALEAAQPKRVLSDEEMAGLEAQHAQPTPPVSQEKSGSWSDWLSAPAAIQSGLVKAATFGNFDPSKDLPGDAKLMYQQGAEQNPGINKAAELVGDVGMGAVLGTGVGALSRGAGALGRIGLNTAAGAAQGGLQKPDEGESRLENAMTGGAMAGTLSTAVEGANKLRTLLQGPMRTAARLNKGQAAAYVKDPKGVTQMQDMLENPRSSGGALQDKASQTLRGARAKLKGEGLKNAATLRELLRGKEVNFNPRDLRGISPELDTTLEQFRPPTASDLSLEDGVMRNLAERPELPASVRMAAADYNASIKGALQDAANFHPTTTTDPDALSRFKRAGQLSHQASAAVRGVGGPEAAQILDAQKAGFEMQKDLRQGMKRPLAYLSSEAPDTVEKMARVDKAVGSGLLDFGDKYAAAKQLATKHQDDAITRWLGTKLGLAGLRSTSTPLPTGAPAGLAEILSALGRKQ